MTLTSHPLLGAAAAAGMLAATLHLSTVVRAQTQDTSPALLLVLDKDALDYGPPPHLLPADAIDPDLAGIGVREEPRYFQSHRDAQVVLPSGQNGSDGWFAVRSVPP